MQHIYWVLPKLLAGRPGPTYAAWSLPELHGYGIRAVLNLSEYAPESSDFDAVGITSTWLPISVTYPSADDVEGECHEILPRGAAFIAEHVAQLQPVLVHCAWGRDRTGLMLAYYLALHQELSPEEAIAAVKQAQPKAMSAPGWEAMSRRVMTSLLNAEKR